VEMKNDGEKVQSKKKKKKGEKTKFSPRERVHIFA
jgi:hypothetical protein